MSEARLVPQPMTRVTCMVHQHFERGVAERLAELGARDILVENARCVRQRVRKRGWGLLGQAKTLDDSPMDVFRLSVPREAAGRVAGVLIEAAELKAPGHGMLYTQDIVEYGCAEPPVIEAAAAPPGLLRDMALLTCILSMPGSGDALARVALALGVGVPVICRGVGTGLRNRLGLLRITIPPEKEIVRFLIPAHDANGIRRLLIEEGRMDRPGAGFLYQTPIREGIADPLMCLGLQGHAASMEQVIAALDDLKGGTGWRKRFAGIEDRPEEVDRRTRRHFREIFFSCAEGNAEDLVRAAMENGAGGATTATADCLRTGRSEDGGGARETGILCVPNQVSDAVLNALDETAARSGDQELRVQIVEAPAVFTH